MADLVWRLFAHSLLAILLLPLFLWEVAAESPAHIQKDEPILFRADQVRNEEKVGLIVATGNVEFVQGSRTLLADKVTYNQLEDTITATGNVTLLEPTGEVVFADHADLAGDLRSGIIDNIRARLADDARLAAARAHRISDTRTEYHKAVYSPCKLCIENPSSSPIWQLKAYNVVHNKKSQNVTYTDSFLEFYGVPFIYTPFLSHPDPSVERRTGFLIPTYGNHSDLGSIVRTPFYLDIAPNMDATFAPMVTSKKGVVGSGEFRHRLSRSHYTLAGSLAQPSHDGDRGNKIRGHFKGEWRHEFNSIWRGGTNLNLVTDDTYLQRYGFDTADTLENRVYAEGFFGKSYASANAYYFRGMRSGDVAGETPIIFPMLDFNYVGYPGRYGSIWKADANLVALTRTDGASTRRFSVINKWEIPYTTKGGELYRFFGSLQTDAYWVNDISEADAPGNTISGLSTRIFPQIGLDWRLPMARRYGSLTHMLEPIVGVIIAPSGKNTDRIPNEDSLSFEFDETNLFSETRFGGIDRVEGGPRVAYGIHSGLFGLGDSFSSFFIGQSYRLEESDDFGRDTGLRSHFSDVVGRVQIEPAHYLSALYRFRLDKDNFEARRNELQASVGVPWLNLNINYLSVNRKDWDDVSDPDDKFQDRDEIALGLTSQFTPKWQFGIDTRRNLASGGGVVRRGAFLTYKDDCLEFRTDYSRDYTVNRDIQPSDTIMFRLVLKTLGEFHTSSNMLNNKKNK